MIHQDRCAMKVTTDGCLFGAWTAMEIQNSKVKIKNILDVGCGTGLLSLMVSQKNNVLIDAIEIDKDAAKQAIENVKASPWKNRINVIHADVLQWKPNKKYDCIISNPPFYEAELKSGKKAKDVAQHEEGLKLSELFFFIKTHLAEEGVLYLLLPAKREIEIKKLWELHHLYLHKIMRVKQSTAHNFFRLMVKCGNKKVGIVEGEIAIKNANNEYSSGFVSLLKDYYLHL